MGVYQIIEYSSFSAEDVRECWNERSFKLLENYIRRTSEKGKSVLQLTRDNHGDLIRAKQFVGVICLKNGDVLEILPKIAQHDADDKNVSKRILIQMLATLNSTPYRQLKNAFLDTKKMSLLEIFIHMFISEAQRIASQGLRYSYDSVDDNLHVYKGKLCFAEHIRKNCAHKERFFVRFDEFNENRAENRLIKATLLLLQKRSKSVRNSADISDLLPYFDNVTASTNIEEDFRKCISDRNMKEYSLILEWCKVFLHGESFHSYSGDTPAMALIFQMDQLFEQYIASLIKKELGGDYTVYTQDRRFSLFINDDTPQFRLRPDIVVKKKSKCIIMDTKWKMINYKNDIAQGDMYQMFAYQRRYEEEEGNCFNIKLLYPSIGEYDQILSYHINKDVAIDIRFLDLSKQNPVTELCKEICRSFL